MKVVCEFRCATDHIPVVWGSRSRCGEVRGLVSGGARLRIARKSSVVEVGGVLNRGGKLQHDRIGECIMAKFRIITVPDDVIRWFDVVV